MSERSKTVSAAAALVLAVGFVSRVNGAYLEGGMTVAAPTARLLAGIIDLVACALLFRATGSSGLFALARLVTLAAFTLAPAAVIASPSTAVATLALVALLAVHVTPRESAISLVRGWVTLGLAALAVAAVVHPLARHGATKVLAPLDALDDVLAATGLGARLGAFVLGVALATLALVPSRARAARSMLAPLGAALVVTLVLVGMRRAPLHALERIAVLAFAVLLGVATDRAASASARSARPTTVLAVAAVLAIAFGVGARPVPGPRLPPIGPSFEHQDGGRVLASGFLAVERGSGGAGVWAIARRADVRFWVDAPEEARWLTIEAGPPPEAGVLQGQRVTLVVGDTTLATLTLPHAQISTHRIVVPSGALVRGDNRLSFHFERLARDEAAAVDRAAFFRRIALSGD